MIDRPNQSVAEATKCIKTISAVQKRIVPTTMAAAAAKIARIIETECSIRSI
jgi:hypothetical protein